jgi:hypothetical protein
MPSYPDDFGSHLCFHDDIPLVIQAPNPTSWCKLTRHLDPRCTSDDPVPYPGNLTYLGLPIISFYSFFLYFLFLFFCPNLKSLVVVYVLYYMILFEMVALVVNL